MLLVALGSSLLGNLLVCKGTIRASYELHLQAKDEVRLEEARIFNATLSFNQF